MKVVGLFCFVKQMDLTLSSREILQKDSLLNFPKEMRTEQQMLKRLILLSHCRFILKGMDGCSFCTIQLVR